MRTGTGCVAGGEGPLASSQFDAARLTAAATTRRLTCIPRAYRTGYSKRWPDAVKYLGTAERGESAVPELHFLGLHPDAAKWLAEARKIKAFGIDTASIDYGQSTLYETHRILYERDIPAFERQPIGFHRAASPASGCRTTSTRSRRRNSGKS
jgi:Putative cyclase